MILQRLINLLIKTHDLTKTYKHINRNILFIKTHRFINKTHDLQKVIRSLMKTY